MNGYGLLHDDAARAHGIIEVWAKDVENAFNSIKDVVEKYPYIALDTEFPGIVMRPIGLTGSLNDYNYHTVKQNVDALKVIQLGITFADSLGNLPEEGATWQFNFRFDIEHDLYAQDSIDFLKRSGVDFARHQSEGIEPHRFGELIMASGLVMNDNVRWIAFHGSYDFGYLLKLLTCDKLPGEESDFFKGLNVFIPSLYDIKFLLRNVRNLPLNGSLSLQNVAEHLKVRRVGPSHQAGPDSLVTCHTFFKIMEVYFDNQIDDSMFAGVIYGLGQACRPPPIMTNINQMNQSNGQGGGGGTNLSQHHHHLVNTIGLDGPSAAGIYMDRGHHVQQRGPYEGGGAGGAGGGGGQLHHSMSGNQVGMGPSTMQGHPHPHRRAQQPSHMGHHHVVNHAHSMSLPPHHHPPHNEQSWGGGNVGMSDAAGMTQRPVGGMGHPQSPISYYGPHATHVNRGDHSMNNPVQPGGGIFNQQPAPGRGGGMGVGVGVGRQGEYPPAVPLSPSGGGMMMGAGGGGHLGQAGGVGVGGDQMGGRMMQPGGGSGGGGGAVGVVKQPMRRPQGPGPLSHQSQQGQGGAGAVGGGGTMSNGSGARPSLITVPGPPRQPPPSPSRVLSHTGQTPTASTDMFSVELNERKPSKSEDDRERERERDRHRKATVERSGSGPTTT
eukprot:GHVN01091733.1.p1 GENE.GHVN01091733.1~~GHVN01091733.1.p1  ORF type:complete len:663 (-),score=127.40 GHVN01091733.1:271-2259(-)